MILLGEKSLVNKGAVIKGKQVTSFWEKLAEEFREICSLNKRRGYQDPTVQIRTTVLETGD